MLDQRINQTNMSLNEPGAAILHARRGLCDIEPKYRQMLTYGKTIDERYAAVAEFLEALGRPGPVPSVPPNAPDDLKEHLLELRALAICGRDKFAVALAILGAVGLLALAVLRKCVLVVG